MRKLTKTEHKKFIKEGKPFKATKNGAYSINK